MKKYQNYFSQGTIISYNEIEVNYNISVCINDLYEIEIVALNLPSEFTIKLDNGEILALKIKSKDLCIYVYDIYTHSISHSYGEEYINEVKIYASHAIIGSQFITVDNLFSSSTIEITNGDELLGIYPYKITHENKSDYFNEKLIIQNNITKYRVSTYDYIIEFYSVPSRDLSIRSNLLDFKGKITFTYKHKKSINQINEYISELLHFFNILSGENITCTNIMYEDDGKYYDIIGYVNYPKYTLNCLKEDGFDHKCYLRLTLPKISDFKEEIQEIYNKWLELYNKYKLTFRIYDDLRLIKENHLFTVNSFLQIVQIIEGYERPLITKASDKSKISLRKCLKVFTEHAISLINSGVIDEELRLIIDRLIDNMVKDRNAYTHADNLINVYLDNKKLNRVVACYIYMFRTVILAGIGVSIQIINNRLFLNREYQYYIKDIFGISTDQVNPMISEFDKQLF